MTKNTPDATHTKVVAVALCATQCALHCYSGVALRTAKQLQQILRVLPILRG